jgi:hypothetical protein
MKSTPYFFCRKEGSVQSNSETRQVAQDEIVKLHPFCFSRSGPLPPDTHDGDLRPIMSR